MKARKQTALPLLERIDVERAQAIETRICTILRTLLREGPGAKRTAAGLGIAHETLLRKLNPLYPEWRLSLAQFAYCLLALGPQAPQVLELLAALLDAPQPHAVQGYEAVAEATIEIGDVARVYGEVTRRSSAGGRGITQEEQTRLDREKSEAVQAIRAIG